MRDITDWLGLFLVLILMTVKWRLGLWGIVDDAIAWIKKQLRR